MKPANAILFALMLSLLSGCALPRVSTLLGTVTPTLGFTATVPIPAPVTALLQSTATSAPLQAPTLSATPASTLPPTASETPSGPTPTETIKPTRTPAELPLTPLPTFDGRNPHSLLPQKPAICPKEDPNVVLNLEPDQDWLSLDALLTYLNAGGSLKVFENQPTDKPDLLGGGRVVDVTGDGVNDVILGHLLNGRFDFLLCKNGQYQVSQFVFDFDSDVSRLEETQDLNQNGVAEMLIASLDHHGFASIYIYEWDGTTFRSLIRNRGDAFALSKVFEAVNALSMYDSMYDIKDVNGDGLQEIVLVDDVMASSYGDGLPAFNETIILGWDGEYYVNLLPGNYQPPTFRFQATEHGDRETLLGNYQKAIDLYSQAIYDENLKWWTNERIQYEYDHIDTDPTPAPDLNEAPRLAAYAYYRMSILYTELGQMELAKRKYDALQDRFPEGNPGHPYAELATSFWDAYLATGRMASACNAASTYARDHPEILDPLGSSPIHGWQSHNYAETDICPFPLLGSTLTVAASLPETATPAPVSPAACPTEDLLAAPNFPQGQYIPAETILSYLNAGGTLNIFNKRPELLAGGRVLDVTGDGVFEIMLGAAQGHFDFIECKEGQYVLMPFSYNPAPYTSAVLKEVTDLNGDGLPELVFAGTNDASGSDGYAALSIYAWDGATFRSLIRLERDPFNPSRISDDVDTFSPYILKDLNKDGLNEISIVDDVPLRDSKGILPAFLETITLGWNGRYYVNLRPGNYGPPIYRFFAVENGDRQVLYGNYSQALALYQQAIDDKKLDWWSDQRGMYLRDSKRAGPTPAPDPAEYERLAAYATYRILILQTHLGQLDAAKSAYTTLKAKFVEGSSGYPYVQIATDFWDAYLTTGSMLNACAAASSATEHLVDRDIDVLAPLGEKYGYFGIQSHTYRPSDVCPFP